MSESVKQSPIKELRERMGVSQGELAMILAVSKTRVGDLERGTGEISPAILSKLAGLGLDPDEIAQKQVEFIEEKRQELIAKFKKSQKGSCP